MNLLKRKRRGTKEEEMTRQLAEGNYMVDIDSADTAGNPIMENISSLTQQIKKVLKTSSQLAIKTADSASEIEGALTQTKETVSKITEATGQIKDKTRINSEMMAECLEHAKNIMTELEQINNLMSGCVQSTENVVELTAQGRDSATSLIESMKETFEAVNKSVLQVNKLVKSSKDINSIIGIINQIAEQTNMLSINASIEAARAGEAGKGFAVVAREVSNLADQSRQSAQEIEALIRSIEEEGNETMKAMQLQLGTISQNQVQLNETYEKLMKIYEESRKTTGHIAKADSIMEDTKNKGIEVERVIRNSFDFSKEVTAIADDVFQSTTMHNQLIDQTAEKSKTLLGFSDEMQQFIASSTMEGAMYQKALQVKQAIAGKPYSPELLKTLMKQTGADELYIVSTKGIVEHATVDTAIGFDLFNLDPGMKDLLTSDIRYHATPIKHRVEDNRLFKFLSIKGSNNDIVQVALSIESLFSFL